ASPKTRLEDSVDVARSEVPSDVEFVASHKKIKKYGMVQWVFRGLGGGGAGWGGRPRPRLWQETIQLFGRSSVRHAGPVVTHPNRQFTFQDSPIAAAWYPREWFLPRDHRRALRPSFPGTAARIRQLSQGLNKRAASASVSPIFGAPN